MIVVLDTNIWKSSLYLKAGAAAAMRFYLHQKRAQVGMPEVIRLEVEHHLRADLREIRDRIMADHKRLLGMVGNLKEVILPEDTRIDEVVEGFISSLDFDLVETTLTPEAARSSFLRTINKVAPSQNNQQFKDGVIWADCLALALTDEVTLVTGDKAFYEDGDIKKGASLALLSEAADLPHKIKIVGSLGALMADIKEPVTVSDTLLIAAIKDHLEGEIAGLLDRIGFTRAAEPNLMKTFYATEKPNILFVELCLTTACEDITGAGRVDAVLTVAADGQYDASRKEFIDLSLSDLGIDYRTADGQEERRRGVYLRATGLVIGTRTVHHQVRELLGGFEE